MACARVASNGPRAYPRDGAAGPAENHHCSVTMFKAAGFEITGKGDDEGGLVMRKRLTPTA
jgi:hypothetical protein